MLKYIWIIPLKILQFFWDILAQVIKNWVKTIKNGIIKFLTKIIPYVVAGLLLVNLSGNEQAYEPVMSLLILAGMLYLGFKFIKKSFKFK